MLSAVQGLAEQFYLANRICRQHGMGDRFKTHLCDSLDIPENGCDGLAPLQVIILPPCLDDEAYASPSTILVQWLQENHRNGAIICSVCAGAFVLAETGLLDGRRVTTHWALADELAKGFPKATVDSSRLLINDGDVITAGGLMSWIDLGLELVAQFSNSQIMRQLGKYLIVDTGDREQSFYQSFSPKLDHGDDVIVKVQHHLQRGYNEPVKIGDLAERAHLTERTFLRRFVRATGLKPVQYLQNLRIQKACDLIETSNLPFERVAEEVGYEDLSAFRKTFIKITGQTPREFKHRFVREHPVRQNSLTQ
ncbi:helix-turn-helix domain-containing protein [Marinobacter salinexigens]|uniref:Helix-turn-helix domain-containing protein n=2 Tax=Marinobacter salinexigens TaxID=2919747 RepID=A0A5B0VID0_9GAMM|nr:helix-turn-helix domain-containing protein [Marinobacter salinexigens]